MTQTLLPAVGAVEEKPLRDYQARCVELTARAVITTPDRGFHYVLPTGTGKTRIARALVGTLQDYYPGRGLVIAHRKELIEQMAAELRLSVPDVGICMAEKNDLFCHTIVGSIQTLQAKRLQQLLCVGSFDWCFIDECHHITPKNSYNTLLQILWEFNPDLKAIGCTATDFRADGESFQELLPICTFTRDIATMQEAGWLAPTVWSPLELDIDLESVGTSTREGVRDYKDAELGSMLQEQAALIAEETIERIGDRQTVVFCASVKQALAQEQAYHRLGVMCESVHGQMAKWEREQLLRRWKGGHTQIVCNVGVLTEGFDYTPHPPNTEGLACVVLARPTMSPGLYIQMLGRGTRLKPGRYKDCLVIDVCGNANLLESKQITLPRVMSTLPDVSTSGELVEALQKEKQDEKKKKPRSLRIGFFEQVAWFATGFDPDTGVYYLGLGDNNHYISLSPDRAGSGLFRLTMHVRFPNWHHVEIVERPVKLAHCAQHINLLLARSGRKNLLAKDAAWRGMPASDKALLMLWSLDSDMARLATDEGWTKGEVGHAIDWAIVGPEIQRLVKS